MFKSGTGHNRSVIPIALRQGNQPDHISKKFNKIHLTGVYPCDYWTTAKSTGLPIRQAQKPSSVLPLMVVLVDDLLHWYDGKMVEDHTRSPDDPDRNFLLRVVLLFWCGDYPGLGEVTNFSHAGYNQCHWCTDRGCHSKGLSRMVYGGYRR